MRHLLIDTDTASDDAVAIIMALKCSDVKVEAIVVENGYDPIYGARPLKRFLQSRVESLLARHILKTDPAPDTTLTVDFDGKQLTGQ